MCEECSTKYLFGYTNHGNILSLWHNFDRHSPGLASYPCYNERNRCGKDYAKFDNDTSDTLKDIVGFIHRNQSAVNLRQWMGMPDAYPPPPKSDIFVWHGRRTTVRISLKFCRACGASIPQFLVKYIWPGLVRSRDDEVIRRAMIGHGTMTRIVRMTRIRRHKNNLRPIFSPKYCFQPRNLLSLTGMDT